MASSEGLPDDLVPLFEGLQRDIVRLFDAFQYGNVTLDQWEMAMRLTLSRHIAAAYMLGSGKGTLAEVEFKKVADQLRKQFEFLTGFKDTMAVEIVNATAEGYTPANMQDYEKIPWRAWKNRAEMYTGAAVEPFWGGLVGDLPIPSLPGDGSSQCLQACRCHLRIVPIQGNDMSKPEGAEGDYDVFWIKDDRAENCQTCLQRAQEWNPLQIRGWELVLPNYSYQVKERIEADLIEALKGGPGSGNFGHSGRPGKHGGSAPQGESLGDKAKYARLEAGLRRRGEKLAAKFQDELRGNPEYMAAQGRINQGRARLVETSKRLKEAHAEHDRIVEESKAYMKEYTDLQAARSSKGDELGRLQKRVNAAERKVSQGGDIQKLDKLKQEYAQKTQELLAVDNQVREMSREFVDKINDFKARAAESLSSPEYKQAESDHAKALADYEEIGRTDGAKAHAIAMKAAGKLRQKTLPESVGGALGKLRDKYRAEAAQLMDEARAAYDRDPMGRESLDLERKAADLKKKVQSINRIGDNLGAGLFTHSEPGNAQYDYDGDSPYVKEGFDQFNTIAGRNPLMESSRVKVNTFDRGRAFFSDAGIGISKSSDDSSVVHELGHALEDRDPVVHTLATGFLERRTKNEPAQKLRDMMGGSYDDTETAAKDRFISPYMGKIYGDRSKPEATEIVSMGSQYMTNHMGRWELAQKDPEYFDFIYALLHLGRI